MRLKLTILVLLVSTTMQAQQVDWKAKYDSTAYKLIAAREVINNIQDYLNLCKKNPKLNKFNAGWVQRVVSDYYYQAHITYSGRKKPVHKTK